MTAMGATLETTMREAMGTMSVAALARAAGVRRELIYQWWRGEQRPTRSSLARVAGPLGLEADDLLAIYAGAMPDEGQTDLTQVLIEEQRETREMLERVLSALAPAAPGFSPGQLETLRSIARQEAERLSQGSDDRPPRKTRSTPSPAGHPMRRQGDNG